MSSLLSHKSIRVKKPTRGHAPNSAGEELRPSDTLIDRCQVSETTRGRLSQHTLSTAMEAYDQESAPLLPGPRQHRVRHFQVHLGSDGHDSGPVRSPALSSNSRELTCLFSFHEGHQFLGEGGWQAVLYEVRDNTKVLADHHSALALTLEKTVVKELEVRLPCLGYRGHS